MDRAVCRVPAVLALLVLSGAAAEAATLAVGPGERYAHIEDAVAAAKPGDVVLVQPRAGGRPYERVGVNVRQKGLTIRAAGGSDTPRVKVSGEGFDHSGVGKVPRAIFQLARGADGCTLEGFEIFGAHNDNFNGAGVRISHANRVTIRNCDIHDNDMGVQSGGSYPETAADQHIEGCRIHHNGRTDRPAHTHNMYLGGTSATVSHCEVAHSRAGSNVKSRAHHTRVEYSYVHHSANREFDLVDHKNTAVPQSDAVLIGNIMVKDPACKGNKAVIQFGQDGGREHDGTLHLVHNTIVTPFVSPVVSLSAPKARAVLTGNLVCGSGSTQTGQQVAGARAGADTRHVTGQFNWFGCGFARPRESGLDARQNRFARRGEALFVNPRGQNYRLKTRTAAIIRAGARPGTIRVPAAPGADAGSGVRPLAWQYRHPAAREERPAESRYTLGAYGAP